MKSRSFSFVQQAIIHPSIHRRNRSGRHDLDHIFSTTSYALNYSSQSPKAEQTKHATMTFYFEAFRDSTSFYFRSKVEVRAAKAALSKIRRDEMSNIHSDERYVTT